ncbi:MAG: KUP/HAK/KT family potassium transporter [Cryomorphaceae bacterium]|nr:KUP/HAK/KT family potassium transporter [Cryomorphaceae bacterium]
MSAPNNKVTAASLLIALGIIYGDIGTSPLYVLKAIVGDRLYALVKRYGKFLLIPTIIGASTLLADGIITPPISVSSAVEGLSKFEALKDIHTVPIVIVIISGLFFFQRFGTHTVGYVFGPAMMIWFSMLFVLGFSKILENPEILNALNPMYAIDFLVNYPQGFVLLGAVFLATTGAEALYSDLGHCGRKNIRITWVFVKVCLVVNYMGQASYLMGLGEGATMHGLNPFYEIMPEWFLIPGIIIATSAAIIASQALISGSYTLINEAMNLNFWPRVAVRQPSNMKGQIYIPSVNIILWIGCVLMVLHFQTSSNMEAAYGLAITITMMVTTFLLTIFLWYKLRWNKVLVMIIMLVFASIEITFFLANVQKFPEGGYITLIISSIFFFIMYTIHRGRRITNRFTKYVDLGEHVPMIKELSDDEEIPKFATHMVYLTKANVKHEIEEKIIKSILSKKPKRADVYWFLHLHRTNEPYTLCYDVNELVDDKIIKINIHVGFRVQPRTELYFKKIVQDLIKNKELNLHNRPDGSTKYNNEPDFKFMVIEKFLSAENEFTLREGILLNSYFWLKQHSLSDQSAFGLDKSDVVVEQVPLVYQPVHNIELVKKTD